MRQRPGLISSVRDGLRELERDNTFNPALWQPGEPTFKAGVKELVRMEETKVCAEIEAAGLDYFSLEQVAKKLSGRKKEQQQALREKRLTKGRLEQLWEQLKVWCAQPGSAMSAEQRAQINKVGAVGAALRQHYPWDVLPAGASSTARIPRLQARLTRAYQDLARCKEEESLIEQEVRRALQYYAYRVRLLEARMGLVVGGGERYLLEFHLAFNQRMLAAFQLLARKGEQIPEDLSRLQLLDD
ncbi:hypothetical protein PLESTB_001489600 [Pleodorina starrii]|uniref:Uncharacterized protein n=1 Tax=Pleodorina starrii TaxID=330485 RepID=A0A9W6F7M0_9CHLO|nr:hypothetical protein PLESTM_001454100 [Pleodorina starrii]GLC59457.1 hypothetical protein PLESTB_001489600 [Pleodorina starrii]GLC66342.1 hypothetical protein PLESTF_000413500 [Pleodorina starrii]